MSIKFIFGTRLGLFLARSTPLLAYGALWSVVPRGNYVADCSTAFRSATEENDSGGHVVATCPTKVAQPNSTADWLRILVTSPD